MLKILIVDDRFELLELYSLCCKKIFQFEYQLSFAFCGNEAIHFLQYNRYDFCLCDFNMPEGNGEFVLKFIYTKKLATKFIHASSYERNELGYSDELLQHIYFQINKPDIISDLKLLNKKILDETQKFQSVNQNSLNL